MYVTHRQGQQYRLRHTVHMGSYTVLPFEHTDKVTLPFEHTDKVTAEAYSIAHNILHRVAYYLRQL